MRPASATDEQLAYLNQVHYAPHKRASIVGYMAQRFGLSEPDADQLVTYWLETRTQNG